MRRREFVGGAVAAAAGSSGCRKDRSAGIVRVAVVPYLTMASFYTALELGYFSQAGIEARIEEFPVMVQLLPLLAGGKLDVGFLALTPGFVNAVSKGARARIVAGREFASPDCGDVGAIYGNRKAFPKGLTEVKQLKGKRISIAKKSSIGEFWLDSILESGGVRPEEVKVVELLQSADATAALLGGHTDARVGLDFDRDPASRLPQVVRGMKFAQARPNFQFSHVVYGRKLLDDVDLGTRFLAAYLRGSREFVRGKTPRFLVEYAKARGLDPVLTRQACRDTFEMDGQIKIKDLDAFIDWTVRKGYCPPGTRAAQLVDTRFLDRVRNSTGSSPSA